MLIRDFPESLQERGRTAQASAKHALTVWADALGLDWPITNPLVLSEATVGSNKGRRQAAEKDLETVRKLEETATNVDGVSNRRAFAAGILLITYARLRFADVQKIRSFMVNDESAHCCLQKQRNIMASTGRGRAPEWESRGVPTGPNRCWTCERLT